MLKMLAIANGQEWNASQIGKSLGVSYHTANHYSEFLESAFLVRRLQAYSTNIRNKVVKRPKVCWRDTGLLHASMRTNDHDDLMHQPWVGSSWEGFVVNQTLDFLKSRDIDSDAFHFRTIDQREIDLFIQIGLELHAIEVKLTSQPQSSDLVRLNHTADLISADRRYLVCKIDNQIESDFAVVCNLPCFIATSCLCLVMRNSNEINTYQ